MSLPTPMSRLGLGCYALGGGYGSVDLRAARATIDAALDAGWCFLDTAEAYLESEDRLGEILKGRRDRVFLATKVFPCESYSYQNMRLALDNSLRKLRTDHVDLYQLHGPQDWVTAFEDAPSLEELAESLNRLVDSGDVLHVGVCNWAVEDLSELHRRIPIYSSQNLYSMYDRGDDTDVLHLPVEQQIIPWAKQNGVGFIAFSPLARGLLADRLDPGRTFPPDDERHFLPRFQADTYPHWAAASNRLEAWAKDHGKTLVKLAVAWVLATDGVSSALIGAKTPAQVEAVTGADTWNLSSTHLAELETLVRSIPAPAAKARSIVWDHFTLDVLIGMRQRRHAPR